MAGSENVGQTASDHRPGRPCIHLRLVPFCAPHNFVFQRGGFFMPTNLLRLHSLTSKLDGCPRLNIFRTSSTVVAPINMHITYWYDTAKQCKRRANNQFALSDTFKSNPRFWKGSVLHDFLECKPGQAWASAVVQRISSLLEC